jgi:hypothetical protein
MFNGTLTANIFANGWSFNTRKPVLKTSFQGLFSCFALEYVGQILERGMRVSSNTVSWIKFAGALMNKLS